MDYRDNPRGDGLLRLGIIFGGSFVLYRFAQAGGLGPAAQALANSLWGAAASTQLPNVGVTVGGGGVAIGAPGAPGARPRCPDFIPGRQYVAALPGGVFETVINGAQVFQGTQAEAEARYRAAFGC